MRFKHYEGLRTFCVVARQGQISAASEELNLTKGAVSHQIKVLESELGFDLFHREARGVRATQKGQQLLHVARSAFDSVDRQIMALREERRRSVTLGTSTYFASRWLSPRLMEFTEAHPKVRLRIQPMVNLFDLEREGIDIAIRWGKGDWSDMRIEPLFQCPAFPTASPTIAEQIGREGLESVMRDTTLLDDRDGSTAWAEWLADAGLPEVAHQGSLTIPDPNVRVQAVLDGQGIAINDRLVQPEIVAGKLRRISEVEMQNYGYHLAIPADAVSNPDTSALVDWLKSAASSEAAGV
ncbi:MAG: LysR substrate-binding domain-containing protein [Pseudomonadota bacterium]